MSVHLFTRSHYSLLNGLMSVPDIILTAKERGFTQIAITEYRVMYSHLEFYLEAKKNNIKPIFGLEVDFKNGSSTLLAKNIKGYQTLQELSYLLSQQDYITLEDFSHAMNDLIFIVHSENGPFEAALNSEDYNEIHFKLLEIKRVIPEFYIGLSHQESNFFKKRNETLNKVAQEHGIECLALAKVYYRDRHDHETFRALRAIEQGKLLDDPAINYEPDRHFYSQSELTDLYDASWNKTAMKVADLCNVSLLDLKTTMPTYQNDRDVSNDIFLKSLAQAGLKRRRNDKITADDQARLDYELSVLTDLGFTNYFLVVYDVIRYAKQKGINVGPGRGSAAGSLTAYALGITEVDPMAYNLLFERFLNPERLSMPDIDIDFPDDKRDEVVRYVQKKYGFEHVAHIIAFGTLRGRQSFRDSGRILNIPLHKIDQAVKMISQNGLKYTYQKNQRFKLLIDRDRQLKSCFDLALKLENTPRHITQHAAGIVLSEKPLLSVVPLYKIDDETHVIQYDMTHIEKLGLIKIDFLGIRNLSLIDRISKNIKKVKPDFKIQNIPFDNHKTYNLISKGHTTGIFQLESDGMKQLLRQMQPRIFTDIVDAIALYRPGPMENIPQYLKYRNNPNDVTYYHNDLREITKDTYGILIYQEQIMQVAQVFAGFTLSKADILRRAMSEKNQNTLQSMKKEFVEGARLKGYEAALIEQVFQLILRFANYGFNKSHSVAYSMVSYQLSYLKANYPEIFYTELLTSVIGDERKTKLYIDECRNLNVTLLTPNLETSTSIYTLKDHQIQLPLTLIKGITRQVAAIIEKDRATHGSYTSFYLLIARLTSAGLKKTHFERLIDAGAMDYLGYNRLSYHASLDEALQYTSIVTLKGPQGQIKFDFNLVSEPVFTQVKNNRKEVLAREFQVLGFYLSDYPTLALKRNHNTDAISQCVVSSKSYRVIVKVDRIKEHRAKNGRMMAFLSLSDDTGTIDGVVFPNIYEREGSQVTVDDILLIKGKVKEVGSILIDKIHVFSQ